MKLLENLDILRKLIVKAQSESKLPLSGVHFNTVQWYLMELFAWRYQLSVSF